MSRTKRTNLWLTAYAVVLCGAVSPALAYEAQEESSAPAVKPANVGSPPADAIQTASGIKMEVLKPGGGTEHPAGDDCVVLRFTAWKRDGSLFANSGGHGESSVQCLRTAIPGISEALKLMRSGEKRRVWIPAELAFAAHIAHHGNKHVHSEEPERPDLTVDVELIRIMKAPVPPSDLRSPPPTALKTSSGVVIQVLEQGTGTEHPSMNSRVQLNYTGWTADGKLFESTRMSEHPAVFLLGTTLAGWREALPLMVVGEKARIWIPAQMAFGEHPIDKPSPAGSLIYDIELLGFN